MIFLLTFLSPFMLIYSPIFTPIIDRLIISHLESFIPSRNRNLKCTLGQPHIKANANVYVYERQMQKKRKHIYYVIFSILLRPSCPALGWKSYIYIHNSAFRMAEKIMSETDAQQNTSNVHETIWIFASWCII